MNKQILKKPKIMVILGTRPEAIKLAPVIHRLYRLANDFETMIVATAQHRELLDQALSLFNIQPDIDLNLMHSQQGLIALTGRILEKMSNVFHQNQPDIVLVHGDTTTAFVSALAAFYQQIPIGHVEAGLRSYNNYSPFPEEMNRRLTTAMTDIHFAPTPSTREALLSEGVSNEKIVVTGNTVVDSLKHILKLPSTFNYSPLQKVEMDGKRLVLVTSHRRESWGAELQNICEAVKELTQKHSDIVVVYPVHPNPIVKETAARILGNTDRVHLIDPLDYVTFVRLMKKAYIILTDSGGLQEEAPSLGKPLLLMRNITERPEAFDAGLAKIVGTDRETIVREADILLNDAAAYASMTDVDNPYGDGLAADRIATALIRWSNGKKPLITPFEEFNPNASGADQKICQNL